MGGGPPAAAGALPGGAARPGFRRRSPAGFQRGSSGGAVGGALHPGVPPGGFCGLRVWPVGPLPAGAGGNHSHRHQHRLLAEIPGRGDHHPVSGPVVPGPDSDCRMGCGGGADGSGHPAVQPAFFPAAEKAAGAGGMDGRTMSAPTGLPHPRLHGGASALPLPVRGAPARRTRPPCAMCWPTS